MNQLFRPPSRGNPPIPDAAEVVRDVNARIPDAPVAAYPITSEQVSGEKRRARKEGKETREKAPATWSFSHDGKSGIDGSVVEFTPIELPAGKLRTISIQLINDTTIRGVSRFDPNPPIVLKSNPATYEDTQFIGDPGDDKFRVVSGEPGVAPLATILVGQSTSNAWSEDENFDEADFVRFNSVAGTFEWNILSKVFDEAYGTMRLECEFVPEGSSGAMIHGNLYTFSLAKRVPPTEVKPNAAIRARIRYSAGKAEDIEFDCDWRGEVELTASRVELRRVVFKPDTEKPFHETSVRLRAIAAVDGPAPRIPATYTVPVAEVVSGAYRTIPLPALAQRVSLLTRYGNDPLDPGDAPLGQIFVSFGTESGNAMGYVDAMSARETLFGAGLSIPAGAVDVVLVNLSPDPVDLGAIFHLAV